MRVELENNAGGLSVKVAIEDERAEFDHLMRCAQLMIASAGMVAPQGNADRNGAVLLKEIVDSDIRLIADLGDSVEECRDDECENPWIVACRQVVSERQMCDETQTRYESAAELVASARSWISAAAAKTGNGPKMVGEVASLSSMPNWLTLLVSDIQGLSSESMVTAAAREHIAAVVHEGQGIEAALPELVPTWAKEVTAYIAVLRTKIAALEEPKQAAPAQR